MELSRLLGTSFACDCGRVHSVPVRRFLYERDAVESLPEIMQQCGGHAHSAIVIADVRTWEVCGRRVQDVLTKAGANAVRVIVPDGRSGGPVCDDVTVGPLVEQLRGLHPDVVVAVGSGVINDLAKWASFQLGIPYLVVATAASMNGYSSANVAPTVAGVKLLFEARPPVAVVAEPAIIEQAPAEMTAAGFGDTIAKHQSNADWVTNRLLFDEYYCKFCASIVTDIEPLYLDRPEDIRDGKPQAIQGLFEALFCTGMAMTLVGTSAPASGGEHLFSHTLDMIAACRGERHDLHGRQVGLGTVLSAALFQKVLAMDSPAPAPCRQPSTSVSGQCRRWSPRWPSSTPRRGSGPSRSDRRSRGATPGTGSGPRWPPRRRRPRRSAPGSSGPARAVSSGGHRLLAGAGPVGHPAHARDPQTLHHRRSGLADRRSAGPGR